MLANPPWRQLRVRAPEDSGRPEARLRIDRIFSHTKYIAQFNTGQKCPPERVAANADNDVQDGAVSQKGVVAFCPNEEGRAHAQTVTFVSRLHR